MASLSKILDYDLVNQPPTISASAQSKITNHTIVDSEDWGKSFSKDFIQEVKIHYSRRQGHKCAYCRSGLTPDGYCEPVEHITPRLLKPYWMFVTHNLVASCGGCNSSKGTKSVLRNREVTYGNTPSACPNVSVEYRIFNPHFDRWSDHFEVEDDFFLKPKSNTKGPFTYTELGMNRYYIILEYIFMLKLRTHQSNRTLTARLRKEKDPAKYAAIQKAIESILNSI